MNNYTDQNRENQVQNILSQFRGLHLDGESIDNVKTYLRYIAYRKFLPETSFNFRIHGKKELAESFIELLEKWTRPESSDTHSLSVREPDLLNMSSDEILSWKNSVHLLLIYDCKNENMSAEDRQEWLRVCDCFEQLPGILKILSAPDEVMQSRFYDDSETQTRVFYGHFSQRIGVHEIHEDDILQMIYEKLDHASGNRPAFTRTEEFNQKLEQYIYTVYKKADRQEETFVDDMIKRIINVYLKKDTMDFILDGSCIPYYRQNQDTDEPETEKKPEEPKDTKKAGKQITTREENLEIKENFEEKDKDKDISEEYNESGELNLLITNVSLYIRKNSEKPKVYVDTLDEHTPEYQGYMTNEAPIISLIHRLKKTDKRLDRIIYIESKKVSEKKIEHLEVNGGEVTSAEYLRRRINYHTQTAENLRCVKYDKEDSIGIADEPSDKEVSEAVFGVYDRILELAKNKKNVNIYIESNGGIRYVLTMLLSVTKTLEKRHKNIQIKEITSMPFSDNSLNPTKIVNTKKIYDTAQITGIVDEFLYYGRVESLKNYAEELKGSLSEDEKDDKVKVLKDDMDKVINKLSGLSDNLQLCRTNALLEDLYGKTSVGSVIERYLKETEGTESAQISIFRLLLEEIKSDLDEVIYKNFSGNNTEEAIQYLPNAIRWCLDKDFIQQALTLSAERFPKYLVKTGRMVLSDDIRKKLDDAKNESYEKNYYLISHWMQFEHDSVNDYFSYIINTGRDRVGNKKIWNKIKQKYIDRTGNGDGSESKLSDQMKKDLDSILNGLIYLFNSYIEKLPNDNPWKVSDRKQLIDEMMNDFFENTNTDFQFDYSAKSFKISTKKNPDIYELLSNQIYNESGTCNPSKNLDTRSKRLSFLFEEILKEFYTKIKNPDIKQRYDAAIDMVFPDTDSINGELKNKYSIDTGKKFYFMDTLSAEEIASDMEEEDFQTMMYLYSICKEQRNLSNHATGDTENAEVALNPEQLKVLITKLLEQCDKADPSHT